MKTKRIRHIFCIMLFGGKIKAMKRTREQRNICKRRFKVMLIITVFMSILLPAKLAAAVTPEEDAIAVKGIDVSEYNGAVNFDSVKKQGYTYVMIRVGAGKQVTDSCFADNYGNAGTAGMKRGAYYYSYATTVKEAKAEAKRCIALLDKRNLEYPVAYDIEEDAAFKTGKDNVTAMAVAFCEEIKSAGYEPMLYSSLNKLNEFFDYNSISGYKIWIANYDVDYPNYAYPYAMWQYTIGSVAGANTGGGQCDENYVYETFTEASTIQLAQTELALQLGEGLVSTASLAATVGSVEASNKHVNWKSEDEKVAVVDAAGNVQAIGNGTTNIVASTVNGIEAKCSVTVTTPATGITIGNESLVIGKKENFNLQPVLVPDTSTDKTTYVSSDESIVRVEDDGSLTGVKKGSAEITATTDSGVSTKVTVEVKKAPWALFHDSFFKTVNVGETFNMGCRLPKNSASNSIEYYSRNQYRVSVDDKGNATALAEGWCLIRGKTFNGKKAWTLVHVKK